MAELLASCPELKTLVTSRAPLRLSGEHQYPVPPLELPEVHGQPDLDALAGCPAVALFLQRAQAVRPDFELTPANAAAVAEICVCLDGLPLAIELAAARVRMLAPEALLPRLDRRLELLTGGARDLPARQQTLRAAIDWSYAFLGAREQELFARLAVFVGGFTLEAAQAVCVQEREPSADVLAELGALVEQSLLQHVHDSDGEGRFAMLETIREYALERLAASGQAGELHRRHAEHFLAIAARAERLRLHPVQQWRSHWFREAARKAESSANEPEWGERQIAWLERLQAEHDNLRAALAWAGEAGETELQLRLAAGLWRFWFVRAHLHEGRKWLAEALASAPEQPASLRAKALNGAAFLAHRQGDNQQARVFAEDGLALCRELADTRSIARSLEVLALVASSGGDHDRARALREESLALFESLGDKAGISAVKNGLATEALFDRDYERATLLFEQAIAVRRELADKWGIDAFLTNLALAAIYQGRDQHALSALREGLALSQQLECTEGTHYCLEIVAGIAASRGNYIEAARYLGGAEAVRDAISSSLLPHFAEIHQRTTTAVRAGLDEESFAAAWAQGHTMTLEQALDCAATAVSELEGAESANGVSSTVALHAS